MNIRGGKTLPNSTRHGWEESINKMTDTLTAYGP